MNGSGGRVWRILVFSLLLAGTFLAGSFYSRAHDSHSAASTGRVIRCYRDPMHPSYTSDRPGTAPDCGMKLEPVYAEEAALPQNSTSPAAARGMISVGPEKQQLIGAVRGSVERGPLTKTVRTLGRVAIDESRIFPVTAGADGVVRKVFPASTNTEVQIGQPLVAVYGREYVTAQRTLLYGLRAMETAPQAAALDYQDRPAFAVEEARLNLLDMGFGEAQVKQITRERKPLLDVLLVAPNSGIVMARNAFPEQRFNRGAELFRIADLSRVWIIADLFGEDARSIRAGASAGVSLPDAPQNKSQATVSGAQPRFNPTTRALTVRLEMANPHLLYRPDMFVDVEFSLGFPEVTSVPADAVLDSGLRKTVFVDHGNGMFEARAVETGSRFDGRVEIVRGLQPGESIVVSGNFLLDSESRMRTPSALTGAGPNRTSGKAREKDVNGHD